MVAPCDLNDMLHKHPCMTNRRVLSAISCRCSKTGRNLGTHLSSHTRKSITCVHDEQLLGDEMGKSPGRVDEAVVLYHARIPIIVPSTQYQCQYSGSCILKRLGKPAEEASVWNILTERHY